MDTSDLSKEEVVLRFLQCSQEKALVYIDAGQLEKLVRNLLDKVDSDELFEDSLREMLTDNIRGAPRLTSSYCVHLQSLGVKGVESRRNFFLAELRMVISKLTAVLSRLPPTQHHDAERPRSRTPPAESEPVRMINEFLAYSKGNPECPVAYETLVSVLLDRSISASTFAAYIAGRKYVPLISEFAKRDVYVDVSDKTLQVNFCRFLGVFISHRNTFRKVGFQLPVASKQQTRTLSPDVEHSNRINTTDDPLYYMRTTMGFLGYCKAKNGGHPISGLSEIVLPDIGTISEMFRGMEFTTQVSLLIEMTNLSHPIAEKVMTWFNEFSAAHFVPSAKVDTEMPSTIYSTWNYVSGEEMLKRYRAGHPELKDDPTLNANIDFYRGAAAMTSYNCFIDDFHCRRLRPSSAGYEISSSDESDDSVSDEESRGQTPIVVAPLTVETSTGPGLRFSWSGWFGQYEKLEREHSYIQWLFPLQEGEGMSWSSQALQKHEIEMIMKDPAVRIRFRRSYELMLDFYGIKLEDTRTGSVVRSKKYLRRFDNLNRSPHNYLRITRILKCLGEVGFENYKLPLIKFLINEVHVKKQLTKCADSLKRYWIETLRIDGERESARELLSKVEDPTLTSALIMQHYSPAAAADDIVSFDSQECNDVGDRDEDLQSSEDNWHRPTIHMKDEDENAEEMEYRHLIPKPDAGAGTGEPKPSKN